MKQHFPMPIKNLLNSLAVKIKKSTFELITNKQHTHEYFIEF